MNLTRFGWYTCCFVATYAPEHVNVSSVTYLHDGSYEHLSWHDRPDLASCSGASVVIATPPSGYILKRSTDGTTTK